MTNLRLVEPVQLDVESTVDLKLQKEMLDLKETLARWRRDRPVVHPIVLAFESFATSLSYSDTLNIGVCGTKDALLRAWRILRQHDFECAPTEKPQPGQNQWSSYWTHKGSGIRVWLMFTSTQCVRKKVGTKTVEQDVYEVVCDAEYPQMDAPAPLLVPAGSAESGDCPF